MFGASFASVMCFHRNNAGTSLETRQQGAAKTTHPENTSMMRTPLPELDRRVFLAQTAAVVPLLLLGTKPARADKAETPPMVWTEPKVTRKGYIDMSIGGEPVGRLVIAVSFWSRIHPTQGVCRFLMELFRYSSIRARPNPRLHRNLASHVQG